MSHYDAPFTMAHEGVWDIVEYSHHTFGDYKKKKKTYDCKDEHEIGASSEASCIWDALWVCVASLSNSVNGNTSLNFQSCMEHGSGSTYIPFDWLTPSNSKKGHEPYAPSAFTLNCLSSTTDVSPESLGECLGLDGKTDAFMGSPGHTLLMQEYAYSDKTFKDAGVEKAGPTVFIDGKVRNDVEVCADDKGNLDDSCKYLFLDAICGAHKGEKPPGCAHAAVVSV